MSENNQETDHSDHTVKSLDKIQAYSDVGFFNTTTETLSTMDSLDNKRTWYSVTRKSINYHRKNGELNFSDALNAMKLGYGVLRQSWVNDSEKGILSLGCDKTGKLCTDVTAVIKPVFFMYVNPRFKLKYDSLSVDDMVACDWKIAAAPHDQTDRNTTQ